MNVAWQFLIHSEVVCSGDNSVFPLTHKLYCSLETTQSLLSQVCVITYQEFYDHIRTFDQMSILSVLNYKLHSGPVRWTPHGCSSQTIISSSVSCYDLTIF